MKWFEIRAVYERTIENGQTAKVKEDYLVEAETVTEAEKRGVEELTPIIVGEFEVESVKKRKIAEIFDNNDRETWFKAKVEFVTLDEKTAAEKRTASTMMVRADDIFEALAELKEGMKGTTSDWEVVSLSKSTIEEIYKHKE